MFACVPLTCRERGGQTQQTDVVQLTAEVVDFAQEAAARQIVSVRFRGLIREQKDGVAEPFDALWHPRQAPARAAKWAIAGITQVA